MENTKEKKLKFMKVTMDKSDPQEFVIQIDDTISDEDLKSKEFRSFVKKVLVGEWYHGDIHKYVLPTVKIKEVSEELNLKVFLSKKTGELSSGQKNRVSLAKSLINEPEILFLDEPTASLDPDIGDYIRSYIQSYKTKNKITIFLASHNMAEVERLCDSIIMMKNGKIIDRGTCEEIIKKHGRNNLEETFLKLARSKDEVS